MQSRSMKVSSIGTGQRKDSWFAHVAITKGTSEWLEAVSDEEYAKLSEED